MAMPSLAEFDVHSDPSSTFPRWQKWIRRFEGAMMGFGITDDQRKKALLLHYGGEELDNIFQTLKPEKEDYKSAKIALDTYFTPKQNTIYETIVFRRTKQEANETIDQYCTRLRQLSAKCDFADDEREIKTQIIEGCLSSQLRRKALEKDRKLDELLELARSISLAESRATEVEAAATLPVNRVQSHKKMSDVRHGKQHTNRSLPKQKQCYHCGGTYPHKTECPARGKKCISCGKLNHFASVCLSAKSKDNRGSHVKAPKRSFHKKQKPKQGHANTVNADDPHTDDEPDYTFVISSNRSKQPRVTVSISNTEVPSLIDTGASVNVMGDQTFNQLQGHPTLCSPSSVRIFPYNSDHALPLLGTFETEIQFKENVIVTTFHVIKGDCDTLISFQTATDLQMIAITYAIPPYSDDIVEQYPDRFQGIGKLKGVTCKLHVNPDIPPVAHQHRRIPFHVRKQTEKELQRLQNLDIIEPVTDEPTPWVSPIQVVKKPNSENGVRICVDMRSPNHAIRRERHVTPTIDDIIQKVNGATHFAKLDLNAGYHQIELAVESRYLTVFSTHIGLFRYKRLNFGVNSDAEVFQHMIQSALQGLDGTLNISDDILIYAKSEDELKTRVHACMQRLRECNLTLNKDKCQFSERRIEFFGHVFTSNGVSPDPRKVQAIANASDPTNAQEVRSLLGLVTYCSRFIPNLATISAPLRELTKENAKWEWTSVHEQAMQQIRESLSTGSTNAYFDPDKSTHLVVDASPVGLGAVLAQTDDAGQVSIIALASRSLTPVEQRYSQTEREALSITWGIQHFHLYLYGSDFVVITDHRPLVSLFNNAHSKPPTRIERWILKLQEYEFCVVYEPGKLNPADYLSRHPLPTTSATSREEKVAEQHINYIIANAVPKSMSLDEIKTATKEDVALNLCMTAMQSQQWSNVLKKAPNSDIASELQSLHHVKDELTLNATSDLLLRNNRIVIPASLRERTVDIAHEGHQGVVKTKQLLREKVWFPGIDRIVERKIKQCIPCQATSTSNLREPVVMSELPADVWVDVSIDFADLPSGEHLLVVTDDYSRFPVVEIVTSTSSKAVIPKLDQIFALFGVPQTVRSDNGPPFNSEEFAKFSHYLGFTHRKITPRWPRANGEVERFMRTLKKVIRTATAECLSWKQELYRFLRNYRATPHATTGKAPATLLFAHPMRTRLPEVPREAKDHDLRERDQQQKSRMKANAEQHMTMRSKPLKCGDKVLIKRDGHIGKQTTPYDFRPFVIIKTKGSMITARRGSQVITRNASFFKLLDMPIANDCEVDLDSTDDEQDSNEQRPDVRRYPNREHKRPQRYRDYVTI